MCGDAWNALDELAKKPLHAKASHDKQRYLAEMKTCVLRTGLFARGAVALLRTSGRASYALSNVRRRYTRPEPPVSKAQRKKQVRARLTSSCH